MKKGRIYTIVFMLIISAVFTFLLAGANSLFLPKIQENARLADMRAVLYVFNLSQDGSADEVLQRFEQNIRQTTISGIDLYEYSSADGQPEAYAIPFTGRGLWGSISGYLGVLAKLDQMIGLVFTDQSETPGLGGRIDELAFREQFRNIAITANTTLTYGQTDGSQIDAITGATLTSNSVMRIINQVLDTTVSKLGVTGND
ncbi:MAG TPA: FMN-binding protein [Candidatus Limiplasma sp.]|nr:FMN-binding protein [Candidatus Limiplasma sp.]HRX08752.1 FMN-binding protein [Candidatus Limiplasma sp.]